MLPEVPTVVLIDGDCALCNATTIWFSRRNQAGRLIFATNQGVTAKIAGEPPGGDSDTVVVWVGAQRLVRSDAILTMLAALGGGWRWVAAVGRLCPRFLRDFGYNFIAQRRKRWGTQSGACTLLSPFDLAE